MMSPQRLRVERIPISRLILEESRPRYPGMVMTYVQQMWENPHDDVGFIRVKPSRIYRGLFVLDDGFHRLLAAVIVGRPDLLAVVMEES